MPRGVRSAGIFLTGDIRGAHPRRGIFFLLLLRGTGGRALSTFNALDTFFNALDIFFHLKERNMRVRAFVGFADRSAYNARNACIGGSEQGNLRNMLKSVNSHGIDASFNTAGAIDLDNAFFKSLGSNGRTCSTCHEPAEGWTITPKGVQARFEKTQGLHPLFRLNDGANSPNAAVSTARSVGRITACC